MGLKHLARIPRQWLPVEVQYRSTFPDINYYRSTTTDFIMTVLGTKSRAWAHEEEWRLVLVGHSGNVSMPPGMIDGVVFGIRINPSLEAMVRSWINDRVPNVELLRVVHKPNSFELEVIPA
jgi:hypothetical protein